MILITILPAKLQPLIGFDFAIFIEIDNITQHEIGINGSHQWPQAERNHD